MKDTRWKRVGIALIAIAAMVAGAFVPVAAETPASGLGAAWPNAQDLSRRPEWHVYVFVRDGIKYIQVNDRNGVVRGGVAASASGDTTIALPLGTAELAVSSVPATSDDAVVYEDAATVVTSTDSGLVASPKAMAASGCTSVPDCSKIQ